MGLSKIADPELAEFAEKDSTETLNVIVELSFRPHRIPEKERPSVPGMKRPIVVLPEDEAEVRKSMDRLEKSLKSLTTSRILRLDTAKAFILDLTPLQLRSVLRLTEVGWVRPNRKHRTM